MDEVRYNGVVLHGWNELLEYAASHPEALQDFISHIPGFANMWNLYQTRQNYDNGSANANDLLGAIGGASNVNGTGVQLDPYTEQWLHNEIARENTQNDQAFQREMRDTSLTSAASQLASLGLSTSNVITTGGAASGVQSQAAQSDMHSAASLQQQQRINNFNQKMSIAKSLIGAAGNMASSGIYGAALGAIKNAASKVSTTAAHSASQVFVKNSGKFSDFKDAGYFGGNNADGYLL